MPPLVSAGYHPELRQVASVVAAPLLGMLLGSALFPAPLPAYVLPFVQGAAVAMAVARCHATASLLRAPSPASTDTMVLLLSALGSVGRAALLVCFQRCYFWATSRALAALNGGLLLARLCLEPHSSTKLGPEAMRFSDSIEARALKQNERFVTSFSHFL